MIPEWSAWANTEIARQCNVSEFLVRTIRNEITEVETEPVKERTRQARRGATTYPMKTGNIGATKSRRKAADVLKPDIAELQQSGTATPWPWYLRCNRRWIMVPQTGISQEPESSMTEHSKSVIVPDQVPAVTPDTPLQSLSTAKLDPGPGTSLPLAVSVISAAAAAEMSLEDAWERATQEDRRNFVMQHRDELQKLLKKA